LHPTGYPHLFRFKLELASAPRWKSNCILLLILARSFLALRNQKAKRVGNMPQRPKNRLFTFARAQMRCGSWSKIAVGHISIRISASSDPAFQQSSGIPGADQSTFQNKNPET
jgi:hypothetical protein